MDTLALSQQIASLSVASNSLEVFLSTMPHHATKPDAYICATFCVYVCMVCGGGCLCLCVRMLVCMCVFLRVTSVKVCVCAREVFACALYCGKWPNDSYSLGGMKAGRRNCKRGLALVLEYTAYAAGGRAGAQFTCLTRTKVESRYSIYFFYLYKSRILMQSFCSLTLASLLTIRTRRSGRRYLCMYIYMFVHGHICL
jgi:hypothetical protein